MTARNNLIHSSPNPFGQRSLFMHWLAWVGGVSILSSGMLSAQTPPVEVVVPTSTVPEPTAEVLPVEPSPVEPAPVVIEVEPAPATIAPEPATSETIAPEPATSQNDPGLAPSPGVNPAPSGSSTNNTLSNVYVDPTDYSIGATSYDGPSSVVITERSSGCQAVLQGQAVPGQLCATPATSPALTLSGSQPRAAETGFDQTTWAERSNTPATVSPLSVTAVPSTPLPSYSAWDYYNRTLRPPAKLGNGNVSLLFPLSFPAPITSVFGWRTHPITGDIRFHSGTDLGAPLGTPVLAAYAGRVTIADFLGGYGLSVVLDHNKSTQETLYAHLSEIFVKPGDWVEQGTVIGRVGSTGNSTGPHLHFEFRQLTSDGWIVLDATEQIEYALAHLVQDPRTAFHTYEFIGELRQLKAGLDWQISSIADLSKFQSHLN